MASDSKDFRLDKYVGKEGKYKSPNIYKALKLSGDYKTSMFDDDMTCVCDCVVQRGCDWEKCTDKPGCPGYGDCSCDRDCKEYDCGCPGDCAGYD